MTVFARNLALESRAVLVTLPLGVLQAGAVVFDPPLPASKLEAIHALQAGKAFKMVTSFRALHRGKSFWPEGMAFLASALDSQLHWPTSLSRRRGQRHLLTHLVGGDAADRFGHHPDPPRAIVNQLVHMFGNERIRDLFVRAEWRVWHDDPYSRSGYSALPEDTVPDARRSAGPAGGGHAVLRRRSRRRPRQARQRGLRPRSHRKRHPSGPRRDGVVKEISVWRLSLVPTLCLGSRGKSTRTQVARARRERPRRNSPTKTAGKPMESYGAQAT